MHPLSDKDLDRLSREAADQFDVEQNPSGWDKLEQTLSKQMPEKGGKERRRFLFFIWLFALLSGGGLIWMLTGDTPQLITLKEGSSRPTSHDSVEISRSEVVESIPGNQVNPERPIAETNAVPGKPSSATAGDHQDAPAVGLKATPPGEVTKVPGSADLSLKRQPGTTSRPGRNKNQGNGVQQRGLVKSIPQQKSGTELQTVDKKEDEIITNPKSTKEQAITRSEPSTEVTGDESKIEQKKTGLDDDASAKKPGEQSGNSESAKKASIPKTGGGFNKGLSLSLVAAPDMSNVKFTNSDKVGFNVGIQLGYRFSQRWSMNTGLLYTRKNYTAEGKDFNPPKGTWIDNVRLDEVEGYCKMYDIPVNIRYDLTTGNKHRYFVSTGLSSYLMKKEDYHYYYQYTNGSPGYRHRSGNSTAKHWASILNISAGVEKKIGRRFSVQAEPYFKIPLTGVGFGNLKLNSYGVYFSTRIDARIRTN